MIRVILPTLDNPASPGGVARYIRAIEQTFPQEVKGIDLHHIASSRREIMDALKREAKEGTSIWTHHIFPVGTCAFFYHVKTKTPYTVFLHGMDFDLARRNIWRRFLAKMILRFADHVVVNSEALGREVHAFSGKEPLVVYPCVADEMIVASANTPPFMEGKRVERSLTLLTVARLVERKGHLKVLEALTEIPGARYLIIGDGPMRETILDRIKELGLSDRVELRTDVKNEELPGIYQSADLFVMPASKSQTDREGFGIVYLEAGLFGLPVIAVNHPGVDEAVVQNQTGILIEDTKEHLLDAMQRLAEDTELRERLGAAAKVCVLETFTREKQMGKLRQIL